MLRFSNINLTNRTIVMSINRTADRILTIEQQKQLDTILNKTFLDVAAYSIVGVAAGVGVSLFFKRKSNILGLFAGLGGSYGFAMNKKHFNSVF